MYKCRGSKIYKQISQFYLHATHLNIINRKLFVNFRQDLTNENSRQKCVELDIVHTYTDKFKSGERTLREYNNPIYRRL